MKPDTFKKIIQLNKDFYDKIGDEFDRTRQNPWPGWGRVVKKIKQTFPENVEIKILDLGCGNGRLYGYMSNSLPRYHLKYIGLDSNNYLLEQARNKYSDGNTKFYKKDIFFYKPESLKKFDVVTAFGVTHHIPSRKFRYEWFKKVSKIVQPGGFLCYTLWRYHIDNRFKKSWPDVEIGDYFLGWNKKKGIYRYVHIYSQEEIDEIGKILHQNGMELLDKYLEDGWTGTLNRYFIWKKVSKGS